MNKILNILFIFFLTSTSAFAYELKKAELENFVVAELAKQTKIQMAQYLPSSIDVKIINLPTTEVVVVTEKAPKIEVVSNFDRFMQYDIKKIIISENGKVLKTIPANVKVSVYKNVLVAKNYINQFDVINNLNTYSKKMEVGANIKEVISEIKPNQPLVAARNVSKDGLILNCFTKTKPDVIRNSDVKIIFKKGDELNIEIEGIALREGRIGDVIVVRNKKYNKMYTATVVEANQVEVKL